MLIKQERAMKKWKQMIILEESWNFMTGNPIKVLIAEVDHC